MTMVVYCWAAGVEVNGLRWGWRTTAVVAGQT